MNDEVDRDTATLPVVGHAMEPWWARADRLHSEEAFRCFMGTNIERLVVGNRYLRKETQDRILTSSYHKTVAAD